MIWQHDVRDLWREWRRRILGETEQFLTHYLAHPHLAVVIPRIRVGRGRFTSRFAEEFWRDVLGEDTCA
jgi:hypothetical protein